MLPAAPQIDRVEVVPFPCYMYVRPWEVVFRVSGVVDAQEQVVVAEMVIPSLTVLFSSSDRSLANRRARSCRLVFFIS